MDLGEDDTFDVTPNVTLFLLTPADVTPTYLKWMQDPRIQRFLESRRQEHSMETLRVFVERLHDDPDTLMMGIRADDLHVGNIKLGPIERHHETAEIGLMIGEPAAWGKGVGRAAIQGVCEIARTRLGLRKVTAGASAKNIGSIRAFQSSGFEIEGRRQQQLRGADGIEDLVLLGRVLSPAPRKPSPTT